MVYYHINSKGYKMMNTKYGIGFISKVFENGYVFVKFMNRKFPLMVKHVNEIKLLPQL